MTSPSTATIGHREKLAAYRKVDSLRTCLIVEQSRRRVERHWRDEHGEWWSETLEGEGRGPVPVIDAELTRQEIYDGVEMPAVSEPEVAESDASRSGVMPQGVRRTSTSSCR